jgi:hypothetical protein
MLENINNGKSRPSVIFPLHVSGVGRQEQILLLEEFAVFLNEGFFLVGNKVLHVNRGNWANSLTCTAVDASIWVDIVLVFPFMNRINRAGFNTVSGFFTDAG